MRGIILAGGAGDRFKPVTNYIPKAMIPIRGKPILDYNVDLLFEAGCTEIYILAGKTGDFITTYYKGHPSIFVIKENEFRGTACFLEYLSDEDNLILNGDSIYDIDIRSFVSQSRIADERVTIGVVPVIDARTFGLVEFNNKTHRISSFKEKPKKKQAGHVSIGVYYVRGKLEEGWPLPASIEKDVWPILAGEGQMRVSIENGWLPIDSPKRFREAVKRIGDYI